MSEPTFEDDPWEDYVPVTPLDSRRGLGDTNPPLDAVSAESATTGDDSDQFEALVEVEANRLRIREAAKQQVALEKVSRSLEDEPLDVTLLGDLANLPPEPTPRIASLMPADSDLLIAAARKSGKTTFVLNMIRSLQTGEPLLGEFAVQPVEGTIAYLNYELPPLKLYEWARDIGIDGNRLVVANLRSKTNPLAGPTPRRDYLATQLRDRNVEMVIVDPFASSFGGETENDSSAVRPWLDELSRWVRLDVGATDLVLVDHMGKSLESTRGSTAKEDWADSIAYLVSGQGDDENTRYFKALGRDVDIEEDALAYDPVTRRLTLTGSGSRSQASQARGVERMQQKVRAYFEANPDVELSGNQLREEVGGQRGQAVHAATDLTKAGVLSEREGPRRARLFSLRKPLPPEKHPHPNDLSRPIPTYPGDKYLTYPDLSLKGEVSRDKSTNYLSQAEKQEGTTNG